MLDCRVQLYLLGYRVTLLNIGDNLLGDRPLLQVRWQLFSAHASGQEHLRNVQVWHGCQVFRPPSLLNRQILFDFFLSWCHAGTADKNGTCSSTDSAQQSVPTQAHHK